MLMISRTPPTFPVSRVPQHHKHTSPQRECKLCTNYIHNLKKLQYNFTDPYKSSTSLTSWLRSLQPGLIYIPFANSTLNTLTHGHDLLEPGELFVSPEFNRLRNHIVELVVLKLDHQLIPALVHMVVHCQEQVRLVSVKAERPNHPSRSHARQGGCQLVGVGVMVGGPPWRHVHDSIGPIRLTVALGLKTLDIVNPKDTEKLANEMELNSLRQKTCSCSCFFKLKCVHWDVWIFLVVPCVLQIRDCSNKAPGTRTGVLPRSIAC